MCRSNAHVDRSVHRGTEERRGLYESSRAVSQVDGLPPAQENVLSCSIRAAKFRICTQNLENSFASLIFLFFSGPAGAQPWKGLRPDKEILYMACRDDKQFFKEITLGQIEQAWCQKYLYARGLFGTVF